MNIEMIRQQIKDYLPIDPQERRRIALWLCDEVKRLEDENKQARRQAFERAVEIAEKIYKHEDKYGWSSVGFSNACYRIIEALKKEMEV